MQFSNRQLGPIKTFLEPLWFVDGEDSAVICGILECARFDVGLMFIV